jgi:hypothetical protein
VDLLSAVAMEGVDVKEGQRVLLMWSGTDTPGSMKDVVEQLQQKVGGAGKVQVEHADKIFDCKFIMQRSK